MQEWKYLFKSHILNRGLEYYEEGLVRSLEFSDSGYSAVVEGTEDYTVEIIIVDGRVAELFCDCPYADAGNYCKHMAAVLYAIDAEQISVHKEINKTFGNELEGIISKLSEEDLRNLVLQIAKENQNVCDMILLKYSENISAEQMAAWKNEIQDISYDYSDEMGYIDYYHASDYGNAMMHFLYEKVQPLIDKNLHMNAFALVNEVFRCVSQQDIDDSDGEILYLTDTCYEFWKQILDRCNDEEERQVYGWFKKYKYSHANEYMEEEVERFMIEEFHDTEILHQKLKYIDELILQEQEKSNNDSYSRYRIENNVLRRIQVMQELGYSTDEIKMYRKEYRQFSGIRKIEIQEYLKEKNYEQVIEVLKESIEIDKAYAGLVAEYRGQLINIYYETGDLASYKKELEVQIFHSLQHDLKYIYLLKNICSEEEWISYREQIIASRTTWPVRYQLLEAEGLFDRLLEEIIKEGSVYTLDQYEKVLKKKKPEKVRDTYVNYVKHSAEVVSNRKQYYSLIQYLKKIAKYPDGKNITQMIAAEWKEKYKRRPAMLDELKKAGF